MGTETKDGKEQRALFGPQLVVDRQAPAAESSLVTTPKLKLISELASSDDRRRSETVAESVDVKALNQALLRTVKFF